MINCNTAAIKVRIAIISSIIPRTSISVARRLLGNPLSSNPPIRLCHSLNQKKNFTSLYAGCPRSITGYRADNPP
nr:Hypothetical protein [Raoultella ornithinolytica]